MRKGIPCTVIRGGTSKGLYLMEKDIPAPGAVRDKVLLRLMGSPDPRQIDGLGGATSVTSKVAIIAPSSRPDADVDYTFAQVNITRPSVSYAGNCGNISSGVGLFAIEHDLITVADGPVTVRIFNTNTQKVMLAHMEVRNGQVVEAGDAAIPGVPGTAAPVRLEILDPAGSVCHSLLPTGNPTDILEVEGLGAVEVSMVDAANPLVFVDGRVFGLQGNELPAELEQDKDLLERFEKVRGAAALRLGLIEDASLSASHSPGVPKLTLLAAPTDYRTPGGDLISAEHMDLHGQMLSMQKPHQTYALTGAMCTAAAAAIPGTLVQRMMRVSADPSCLRIGHPGGIMEAGAFCHKCEEQIVIDSVYGIRTARMLLQGQAFLPEELLSEG